MTSCAIHQPNFFPRPSTLAKLVRADVWVVLDDVQFNARDYQHRARLATLADPAAQRWLTVPVHRPHGRDTRINELLLADPDLSRRRVGQLVRQYYGRSRHWPAASACVDEVLVALELSPRLTDVAEVSTRALLARLGWAGRVVRSSTLTARNDRSARLADLTKAVGADTYLCGPGGSRYLDEGAFTELGLTVSYPEPPRWTRAPGIRAISALWAFAMLGPAVVREELSTTVPA
ncbi:WbqC family protein [Amycolatopsis taiwanensis]|uniref:WbqC family protein n=1 Tax=Amycolatopsis taiwanensis TaxID=342230 RepID=UPI0004AECDF7|nr:WbqC family protein [Amycolatopsis taiwanensis]